MRQLFESVLELQGIEEKFYNQSSCELKRRKDLEKYIEDNGSGLKIEQIDLDIKTKFLLEVGTYENVIKEISNSFKASILHIYYINCISSEIYNFSLHFI